MLRALRESRGLTQQQLASAAGLTTRTLQRIEHGCDPTVGTLRRLAEALNVPVSELVAA